MLGSLFGKRKKKLPTDSSSLGDSIADAGAGDVFTITDYLLELEDSYFIIEKKNRYASTVSEWYELEASDGENRIWVYWSKEGGLSVSVTLENKPIGLSRLGITREDLSRIDAEHSIDNYFTYDGLDYYYQNSREAFYYVDDTGNGEGFYVWDFIGDDGSKALSIDKWEGLPFQGYLNDIVSPDSIAVYKR